MYHPTLDFLVCQYIDDRVRRGHFVAQTVPAVRWHLRSFTRWAGDIEPHAISALVVEDWLGAYPLARSTMRHRLSWFRGWCRWLIRHGHMVIDPTVDISTPRQPRPVARGLAVADISRVLIRTADARLRLIVLLMAQEGFRAVEVARAETGDVDWTERTVWVHGKGDERRLLPISEETWRALAAYYGGRVTTGPLIRSRRDPTVGVSPGWVCVMVSRAMADAGVNGTGHQLRHSMAAHVLRSGRADIRDVQRALGHASLATTSVYLPESDVRRLRNVMAGRWYDRAVG